jgi:hypothetical protein
MFTKFHFFDHHLNLIHFMIDIINYIIDLSVKICHFIIFLIQSFINLFHILLVKVWGPLTKENKNML